MCEDLERDMQRHVDSYEDEGLQPCATSAACAASVPSSTNPTAATRVRTCTCWSASRFAPQPPEEIAAAEAGESNTVLLTGAKIPVGKPSDLNPVPAA